MVKGWAASVVPYAAGVVILLPSAPADAFELRLVGSLPFLPHELDAAIGLRLPASREPVVVEAVGADAVEVRAGGKTRTLPLLGLRGAAAARRIALALADLFEAYPVVNSERPRVESSTVTAASAPAADLRTPGLRTVRPVRPVRPSALLAGLDADVTRRAEDTSSAVDTDSSSFDVAAVGLLGAGTTFERLSVGVSVEASLAMTRSIIVVAGLGIVFMPPGQVDGATIRALQLPLRAGLAYRTFDARVELRLTSLIGVHLLSARDRDGAVLSRSDVLPGVGAFASYLIPVLERFDITVGLGGDLYVARRDFRVRGQPVFATDRLVGWAAFGARFEVIP